MPTADTSTMGLIGCHRGSPCGATLTAFVTIFSTVQVAIPELPPHTGGTSCDHSLDGEGRRQGQAQKIVQLPGFLLLDVFRENYILVYAEHLHR